MSGAIEVILKEIRVQDLNLQRDHRVSPSTPLSEVYEILDKNRHGAAMVCEGDKVVGIFTDRDILYRTALEGVDPNTPVSEVMSSRPVTVRFDQKLADAIKMMVDGGYRHAPVVDADGREVGLLSTRVILKFIADHYPETVLNLPPRLDQVLMQPEGG